MNKAELNLKKIDLIKRSWLTRICVR